MSLSFERKLCHAYIPFGPRRPLLTRSNSRPLTPTMVAFEFPWLSFLYLTPMSHPHPMEHETQALENHL